MKKTVLTGLAILLLVGFMLIFRRESAQIRTDLLLADSLMVDKPDSALSLLQQIGDSKHLSKEENALYALLMTQAQFKNHQPPISDSLLRIAYEYYIPGNDSLRKAQTYLYQARIDENSENKTEALKNYRKASAAALPTKNYDLLALIYNRWGGLLALQTTYDEALKVLQKSLAYSFLNKDTTKQVYALRDIGKSYSALNKHNQALYYYERALKLAELKKNTSQISDVCAVIAYVYKCTGEYDKGLSSVDRSFSLLRNPAYLWNRRSLKGDLFMRKEVYDSAAYYIDLSREKGNLNSEAVYNQLMSELEKRKGNYEKAVGYSRAYIDCLSKIVDKQRETAIARLQKKYDYSVMKNENSQLKISGQKRDNVILVIGIIAIITVALFIYYYNRKRAVKRAMKQEIRKMEDDLVNQRLIYTQERTIEMQKHQNELLKKEKEMGARISEKTEALKQHQEKERELKEHLFQMDAIVRKINTFNSMKPLQRSRSESQFTLSYGELSNLEEAVNLCYDNFTERLRKEFPKLKDDDIHLCCLIKMKVPYKNIMSLLDTNELALKKRRYRIKHDKMELGEDIASLDEFLSTY